MTAMLTLAETDRTAPRAIPVAGDLVVLHERLTSEISQGLGPAHAALFAQPVIRPDRVVWQAPGAASRATPALTEAERAALLAAAGSILSDVRRLGESGQAPTVAACWPHLMTVPGPGAVFAVDGRPVLAPWGYAGGSGAGTLLAGYDDRVPFRAAVRTDWRPYAAALAGVALLAVLAGFGLPALARWAIPAPAMCQADAGQLDLMRQQADAESRGAALTRLLASLNEDVGRAQLLCPIRLAPRPQSIPVPAPTPAPAPAPPPRADLPEQKWNNHDLSMLEGCWRNTTQLMLREIGTGQTLGAREWKLCFDQSGNGRQTIVYSDGRTCEGPLGASFRGEQLVLTDREQCRGRGANLMRGKMECTRTSGSEANCARTDLEGPAAGHSQTGKFKR